MTINDQYVFQKLLPCCIAYVRSQLVEPNMLFSNAALTTLPLDDGSVFSWLPSPACQEWLRHEKDIGLRTAPFRNAYRGFLRTFLAKHASSLVVMEADTVDAGSAHELEELRQLGLCYRHNGNQCFVYLTHNDMGLIDNSLYICKTLDYHAFFMNAYPKAYTWKSGSEISTEEIHDVISHCDSLAIAAYDYMGFILWTRDPEGCIRLNTPASASE